MITEKQFKDRVKALYASQKNMARARKWKTGKREGNIRTPGSVVEFTEAELYTVLAVKVGFNAVPCPYCRVPIDILSLTLDHIIPRSQGGTFTLANMQICCVDDNHRKGEMSHDAYAKLLSFAQRAFSSHDYSTLLKRLKAAHAGSMQRFGRNRDAQARNGQALLTAKQLELEESF